MFLADADGEGFGGVRGGFASGEDAPEGRVALADNEFGDAIGGGHLLLHAVGIGAVAEGSDLDSELRVVIGDDCGWGVLLSGWGSGSADVGNNRDLDVGDTGADQDQPWRAAAWERSMIRLATKGPRSMMRTSTVLSLVRLRTRTMV